MTRHSLIILWRHSRNFEAYGIFDRRNNLYFCEMFKENRTDQGTCVNGKLIRQIAISF